MTIFVVTLPIEVTRSVSRGASLVGRDGDDDGGRLSEGSSHNLKKKLNFVKNFVIVTKWT